MDVLGNYQQGIEALEDITHLGDVGLSPIVNRVYFYMSELKKKAEDNFAPRSPQNVEDFLGKAILKIAHEYLQKKNGITQVCFSKRTEGLELFKWNRLLEILPSVLSVINCFDYIGKIDLILHKSGLVVEGNVCYGQEIESNRQHVYTQFRKMVQNQSLLTFSIDDVGNDKYYKLKLVADVSHDWNKAYCVDLTDRCGIVLGISNIFEQYRLEKSDDLGGHLCLRITDQLELRRYPQVPDDFTPACGEEILHFSFLFRPVSLIIPRRGVVRPIDNLQKSGDTGRGTVERFRYIDFFSLLHS